MTEFDLTQLANIWHAPVAQTPASCTPPTMKTKKAKRFRLYGKRKAKLPLPVPAKNDKGFSLRSIREADQRYAVVKTMRQRLETLMHDANCDTIGKEWLAGRAVFLVGFLESEEMSALEGKEIDWCAEIRHGE